MKRNYKNRSFTITKATSAVIATGFTFFYAWIAFLIMNDNSLYDGLIIFLTGSVPR